MASKNFVLQENALILLAKCVILLQKRLRRSEEVVLLLRRTKFELMAAALQNAAFAEVT